VEHFSFHRFSLSNVLRRLGIAFGEDVVPETGCEKWLEDI
jgi:hypothetical protein